jgi:hypothetical protein
MLWSEPKSEDSLAWIIQPFMCLRGTPILCLSLLWLLAVGGGRAQESPPTEYQLKAAFLYNFAKFVEWPPVAFGETTSPMIIGILGENPIRGDLDRAIRDKTINKRPLVIKEPHSAAEWTNCHILFISTSEKKRLPEILESLHGASVLTVSEMDGFTQTGGMINFISEGNKIRFQINEAAAKNAGLKISSKLLSLATRTGR